MLLNSISKSNGRSQHSSLHGEPPQHIRRFCQPFNVRMLMKIVFALTVLLFASVGCTEKVETTTPDQKVASNEHKVSVSLTEVQAVEIISELPETKAWANYIERKTEGKVHAAIMTLAEGLKMVDGKQYWPVNFYESQSTHLHLWESFLVNIESKEVLVEDFTGGDAMSLQEWRENNKPMERIKDEKAS